MKSKKTNMNLRGLIDDFKKQANDFESPLFRRIADELSKPTRSRRIVNLAKINKITKADETIVVPGKVLGNNVIEHGVTIAAYAFSKQALDMISKSKSKAIFLEDFVKENPKGKKVRIIG